MTDTLQPHLALVDDVADAINWTRGPDTGKPPAPPRRRLRGMTGWLVGLVALPLSVVPFLAYARYDGTGSMLALRAERHLKGPSLTPLPAAERSFYAQETLVNKDSLVVLSLHGVKDGGHADEQGTGAGEGTRLGVRRFGDDLQMLAAAGYRTVTPEQVAAWHAGRGTLPAKALLLTFDDGLSDVVLNAAPLVKRLHMRATMFTIAGTYEKAPVYYASPAQLRRLQRDGWSLEAHAVNGHGPVAVGGGHTLPYMSALRARPDGRRETIGEFRARVAREYRDARGATQALAGVPVVAYAWPFGAYGADSRTNDPRVRTATVEEARRVYALGFNDDAQDSYLPMTRHTDPMRIPRLRVDPSWSPRRLWQRIQVAVASGAPEVDRAS